MGCTLPCGNLIWNTCYDVEMSRNQSILKQKPQRRQNGTCTSRRKASECISVGYLFSWAYKRFHCQGAVSNLWQFYGVSFDRRSCQTIQTSRW